MFKIKKMLNNYFRYYSPTALKFLLVISAICLYVGNKIIFQHWSITIPIAGAIGGILFVLDKKLWRYKLFSFFYWVDDFSGRYEGTLDYEYRDENNQTQKGSLKHVKLIHQTASNITINSFTFKEDGEQSSHSKSIEVVVTKESDDTYTLTHTYLNNGNPELGFPPHYGTEVIKVINSDSVKKLSGLYYTNRLPHTRGKLNNLIFKNNNLNHEF